MAELTRARLRELLDYCPETGVFTRKISRGRWRKGAVAGTPHNHGYFQIGVDGAHYLAHRLAFLFMTGAIPKQVDHINRNRRDNRWSNLRGATNSQNQQNMSDTRGQSLSGILGVYPATRGRWRAYIMRDGVNHWLGSYETKAEAATVRREAELRLFGEYAAR